jgi:hypothetical protein
LRKRLTLLTSLAAGAISALVVGGYAIATGPSPAPPRFDHISNTGTSVPALASKNALSLTGGGARAELRRLGMRGPLAFYVAPGSDSGLCFATGSVRTGGIAMLGCPGDRGRLEFPSDDAPVLNMGAIEVEPNGDVYVLGLAGFAADGVARVGVVDTAGALHAADVTDNLFYRDLPRTHAAAFIAFDATGGEVMRRTLAQGG